MIAALIQTSNRMNSRRGRKANAVRGQSRRDRSRLAFEHLEDRSVPSASVLTDLLDYSPGQTINIRGADYVAGETVNLRVMLNGNTEVANWNVTDGGAGDLDGVTDGNFRTSLLCGNWEDTFEILTATGLTSGEVATTYFTDSGQGSPPNISAQLGWLGADVGDQPTYTITAPAGYTITKIGIKAGEGASFPIENLTGVVGDANTSGKHSPVIVADGTYSGYLVTGLGTGTVTVTNVGAPQGRGLSHIDYFLSNGTTPVYGSISGMKFEDVNGDSLKNGDDAGLGGWVIQLDNDNDPSNGVIKTATTAGSGSFSFTNLDPGTYYVREVQQSGWTQTRGGPLAFGSYLVNVVGGENAGGVHFGNFENITISGLKYTDTNGDGLLEWDTPGTAGQSFTINLYKWTDAGMPDGTVQESELTFVASTETDADTGAYSFTNLGPLAAGAQYFVREVGESGWTQTFGNAGYTAAALSGQDDSDNDFGNFENVLITGHKFYDANVNTLDDDGLAVAGIKVGLDVDNDGTFDYFAYTDASGNYAFGDLDNADGDNNALTGSDLKPGTYFVNEILPLSGWIQTYGENGYSITIGGAGVQSGETSSGNNYGNVALGAGGGHTIGYWSNKNGQATMNDGGTMSTELALLNSLNLRQADGSNADFGTYKDFRTWLLSATATNMQYMLSAQLAAMNMNVEAGFVNGSSLVYAPSLGGGSDFISINDLMNAANAALTLDPVANRDYLESLKSALDAANNNLNFVLAAPPVVVY